ncbi:MAG: acetylglutamate kinase [Halobacteriota archaeon]
MTAPAKMLTKAELALRLAMQKRWEDHVFWGRCYIISVAADLHDRDATVQRVRANHEDIGEALKPFYGADVTNTLKALLLEHTNRAAPVIKALKAGSALLAKDAEQRWYENADQLGTFLSSINPYWPEKEMQAMLYEHLRLSKSEAVHRFSGDYAGDIAEFDEAVVQIIELADFFSNGIIQQFHDRFCK